MDELKPKYKKFFREEEYEQFEEGQASVDRPDAEAGYTVTRSKVRVGKNSWKMGYVKKRKKGVKPKKSKLSPTQRKAAAKKGARTKNRNPAQKKKSIARGVATRKQNKK